MKKSVLIKRILLALMLIGVIVLVSCSFRGCGKEPIDVQVQIALEAVVSDAMAEDAESNELLAETESRSGFEVVSYTETDTGVFVTFLVYAPDLYTLAKELDENYVFETEEELQAAVIEAIGKAEIVEREVTIEFIKTEYGYEPNLSIEFIDAFYGGILKLYNETLINNQQEEVVE